MKHPDSVAIYETTFGHAPRATAFAPGRINIIGEHVDYNQGLVLPTPLAQGVDVSLGHSDDGISAVSTLSEGLEKRGLSDPPNGSWTDYIVGAAKTLGLQKGFKIAVDSSLPAGASVSSSAALLVAVIRAMNDLFDLSMDQQSIARSAQRVENDYLGLQNGLMDQMVSACGTYGKALLFDTENGALSDHDLIKGTSIITLHSGETRRLVGNAYNDRRASCERAAQAIGVASLRQASLADLDKIIDETDRARARHIVSEHDRTSAVLDAIAQGDTTKMGQQITACHRSLSKDFEVSTAAMDALVETALDAGALGARMTGAGFGGCIIVLTQTSEAEAIKSTILSKHTKAFEVATLDF